jgi:hypothetical protein
MDAPKEQRGKWVCYCRDTFDGETWTKPFDTEAEARAYALRTAGEMLTVHIDNPSGRRVDRLGKY